jgi:hypothetical protein
MRFRVQGVEWLSKRTLGVFVLAAALLLAGAFVFEEFFSGKYQLDVSVSVRDSESALLVPVHGAYVFVVPVGGSVDAIFSEYASSARNNIEAGGQALQKMGEIQQKMDALDAQAQAIGADSRLASPDSGFHHLAENTIKLEQILDESDRETQSGKKLSAQVNQLRLELAGLQKKYRDKAARADHNFRQTDGTGQVHLSGIRSRYVVVYVISGDDEGPAMLLLRQVDLAATSSASLGPADDVLRKD